jgi:hypothetical protein
MHLGEYHRELQAAARKRLTDPRFSAEQLDEIAHLLANDMLLAIDNGIDKYTDMEWRLANRVKR